MSEDEFLVFGRPVIGEAEIAEVTDCLRSGWVGTGPRVQRFERLLEEYTGVPHVRCVSSCTAALSLGMLALGVGPGDEVIVPTMTFVATANAVEHTGADVVLVDCEPGTGLMDLDAAEAAISPRTRALMVVHLAGQSLDMDRVNGLRDRHGIAVVEDAAHAIGAGWGGRPVGAHGNITAYSFYATKNITTIEGGALATEDPAIAEAVERLALHGLSAGAWSRFSDAGYVHYEVQQPGFKHNMTDVQAALGIHQLGRLDGWIEQRAQLWERYDELLDGAAGVERPPGPVAGSTHARHLYRVQVPDRDQVIAGLADRGIGSGVHYRAVHLHQYYRERYGLAAEALPVAAAMSDRTLSLPLGPALEERDLERVCGAVRAVVGAGAPAG